MTKEEVDRIKWEYSTHLSMRCQHCTTYKSTVGLYKLGMCVHVPWDSKKNEPKKGARMYTNYTIDGVLIKTDKKFYELMEKI